MYDKTRAGTVSCRDDPQQSSRKSPKVTKGKIVPASVLESKKQRPNKFSLSCVKSFFDKRLKGLSPRDCFPPVGSAAAGKAAGKNTRKKFHMTPNVSGDKCMEIYESEFDNIELRAFSTINKDDFFNLSDKESLETAIGLDVNNAVRSYRSPFKQPKVMPNTNNIYLPAATQIDQTVQPGTPSFALLFGDENYFDENIQSRHLSSSSSSRQNSTTGNNSPTATASWKPSTTTPLNEYVDEDELSRSVEFSLDINSVSHTLSSAYSHSPYQNIDYSNSMRSDRPSHQHSESHP